MAISSGELQWFFSYGMTGSPIQPYTDPGSSPLTGNEGGGITTNVLSGTLNEFFRAIRGTDIQSADFYDYNKIYFKNTNGTLDLLNGGVWQSSKSAYAQDTMSIAIGLTSGAYTVDNAGVGEMSTGREDYDEDTDGTSVCNSPYPRVAGSSAGNLESVLRSVPYAVDGSDALFNGTMYEFRVGSLPANVAATCKCYVKCVGMDDNNAIVVGYADLTSDAGTTPKVAGNTTVFNVDRDGGGAAFECARPLYFSVHQWLYDNESYGGGAGQTAVAVAGLSGPEGDLTDVFFAAAVANIPIEIDTPAHAWASPDTICQLYGGKTATTVGQIFIPVFYEESSIDTIAEALALPTLGAEDPSDGFDPNEYGEQTCEHIAFWIRRKVDQNASSAASVPNLFQIFGDSA